MRVQSDLTPAYAVRLASTIPTSSGKGHARFVPSVTAGGDGGARAWSAGGANVTRTLSGASAGIVARCVGTCAWSILRNVVSGVYDETQGSMYTYLVWANAYSVDGSLLETPRRCL